MIYFLRDEKRFVLHTFAFVRLQCVCRLKPLHKPLPPLSVTSLLVCGSLSLHGAHIHIKTHSVMRGLVGGLGGADTHLSLPKGKASYSPEHSRWAHTRLPEMRNEMRPWKSSKRQCVGAATKKVLWSITNPHVILNLYDLLSFLRTTCFFCASCLILYLEMANLRIRELKAIYCSRIFWHDA